MQISLSPWQLSIDDFAYELPEHRIAQYPLEERTASRLLVYRGGSMTDTTYAHIGNALPPGALLVFNNSKVVEARLLFQKATGGIIEIFALEPAEAYADITTAMNQQGSIKYKCLIGGAAKWKAGIVLEKTVTDDSGATVHLKAELVRRHADYFEVALHWLPAYLPFAQVLHLAGKIPIPPYLHRESEASDTERYQTVYAKNDGSVAAPTAGLHFTAPLLRALHTMGYGQAFTTLHVGAGTFMPVKSATMQGHEMHAEFLEADAALIRQVAAAPTVIPVGTTAMRTLESLYWMGIKVLQNPGITLEKLEMQQWEVYETLHTKAVPKKEALEALANWLDTRNLGQLIIKTRIIIAPGYPFGVCDGLVTNFHQPKSTLLLLVAALVGNDWKRIYRYALEHDFRFLSYGDGSLLLPVPAPKIACGSPEK